MDELALGKRFWEFQYTNNRTGWDMGRVSPPIQAYIDQLEDKHLSILIPGAGNAHEAAYLLDQGFTNITVLDIARPVVEKLQKLYEGREEITIIEGDFFEFEGQYDLIIEQTFFCTLYPHHREEYVKKMVELLTPKGKLIGLLFDREFPGGPPFGGFKNDYQPIFEKHFKSVKMERCYNSHPARQGNELWIKVQK